MRSVPYCLAILAVTSASAALAQSKKPATPRPEQVKNTKPTASADERAIRETADAFVKAFNAGDAKALGALWAANADYVDENGQAYQGRDAIEKEYVTLFNEHPGVTIKIEIASIRMLGATTAMEDGTTALTADGRSVSQGRYTAVHVKEDGKWLISAVRDISEGNSADGSIKAIDSFVGDWVTERDDAIVKTSCKWAVGNRFLLRTFTVMERTSETPRSSGLQIIGWDPDSRQIRSWTFDSSGGHGQGLWSQVEGGWSIESEGVLADGTPTASTELIERVDNRIIGWQSINRTAGGEQLPDTEQVVLERVQPGS